MQRLGGYKITEKNAKVREECRDGREIKGPERNANVM
jgi:hypothetical protein